MSDEPALLPLKTGAAREATSSREWSSMMLKISTSVPPARPPMGAAGLPALVGLVDGEAFPGASGSFCGWVTTMPRLDRIRWSLLARIFWNASAFW